MAEPSPLRDLASEFRAGNVRGLARAITLVERRDPAARELLRSLAGQGRRSRVVGLTGAPGTGKSTLSDGLIRLLRAQGASVAVIAVDPNSPYSGGAILGDRVRMQRHALDPQVYIRSMGSRGHLGGLAVATREAVRLLAAFGFDYSIVETVGVGQSELEVAAVADTTLLVLAPESGDGVQMIKAGIMEIADVFVVNKSDLPGAQKTIQEVRTMLGMGPRSGWRPPVVAAASLRSEGLEDVLAAIEAHHRYLETSGEGEQRAEARLKDETADLVGEWARDAARRLLDSEPELVRQLLQDRVPYAAAEVIRRRAGLGADGAAGADGADCAEDAQGRPA